MINLKKLQANMAATLKATLDPSSRLNGHGEQLQIPTRAGEVEVFFHHGSDAPKSPVLFELHGGGFAFGDAADSDPLCEQLCHDLEIDVISINYRRTPLFPYPAALHDVYDAILYIHDHAFAYGIDPARMAVIGHSAGGNLTAAVSILANRTKEFSLACQLMTYPYLEQANNPFDKPKFPQALPPATLLSFRNIYSRPDERRDPLVSPVFAREADLAGLPPALILTAEFDSLNAEGEFYARLLQDAGVPTAIYQVPHTIHGFLEDYFRPATSGLETNPEIAAAVEKQVHDALGKIEEMLVRTLHLPEESNEKELFHV